MIVKLVGNKKILKMELPENVEGNYWLSDNSGDEEQKIINIRSVSGNWIATSNNYSKIINERYVKKEKDEFSIIPSEGTIIKDVGLEYYKKVLISLRNREGIYALYPFPIYEKNTKTYKIIKNEITIGSSANNDIVCMDNLVKDVHARIFLKNGKWYLENYDMIFGTFLNNKFVEDENIEVIENGDIILISGIKFMLLENSLTVMGALDLLRINDRSLAINKIEHIKKDDIQITEDQDDDIELYREKDYFYSSPRIIENSKKEIVSIDKPSTKEKNDNTTQVIALLSSAGMAITTVLTLIMAIAGISSGNSVTKLITPIVMLIVTLSIPILRILIRKKHNKKEERKRQFEYRKYINSKIIKINEIIDKQTRILKENNMLAEECERVILEKSHELWERKIEDEDFLNINLGNGEKEIDIGLDKTDPAFSVEEDNLLDIYYNVVNSSRIISGVPISISLTQNKIVSIIGEDSEKRKEYMETIILQLIALQNYRNLKLVFFLKDINEWDFIRMIPHIWDDSNSIRFLASKRSDINEIAQYLDEIANERLHKDEDDLREEKIDYKEFDSYFLIITDNYRALQDIKVIDEIINNQSNFGFSLMCITDNIKQSPNKCKAFVQLEDEKADLYLQKDEETVKQEIEIDKFEKFDYSKISKKMSNIPIKYTSSKALTLPNHYSFLEMFNSGNIDQLNILDRWSNNDSTKSLRAEIGIDVFGNSIYLDAHEKYHGPHGLIAGTTGSGKSEFIITYILSLAINYHPDDVTFVLIDYKGGGLAGAFKKKNMKLPHLVGTITNIDEVGLQRSLESIQSELKRRQIMFNEAKNLTNESTIDIYKYQRFYHDGVLKEPISHLFIICDEFAELKQQQPDFMAELMSVSRIGRSLGVHLILATQKPAGIVNEQIRSNSKFGICLKVQNKSDSKDIIGKTDAATLKNAGQFYINVGNDEYFTVGQSGYTGAPYIPSDVVKKEQNTSIEFISDNGTTIKKIETDKKANEKVKNNNNGDQLTNIVNYLYDFAKRKNIVEKSLWLDQIADKIYVSNLRKKYQVQAEKNIINPIIGEYDDPLNQLQNVLTVNLSTNGNTLIYGSSDSGKELVLYSILYDSMLCHTSDEVEFYLIDFGSETLRMFADAPNVGDVMLSDDTEKIARLFSMIKKEIKNRKKKLLPYNGDYDLFLKNSDEKMPMIVIAINEFGNFLQRFSRQEEEFVKLFKESTKYGIVFVITANAFNEVRSRISQNFRIKLVLQLIAGEYSSIINKAKKKKPSSIYGRGLCLIDDETVCEFQTARIFKSENLMESIKAFNEKLKKKCNICAPAIPVVPEEVKIEDVKNDLKGLTTVPIGISTRNIETYTYDFTKNIINIVATTDIDKTVEFISALIQEIKLLKNVDVVLFDEEELLIRSEDSFVSRFNKMTERINENYANREKKNILYVIIGIGKFMEGLGTEKERFTSNLNGARLCKNCNFIIVDTASRIKGYQMDSWYKKYMALGNGIYIGNGFDIQLAITTSLEKKDIVSSCGDSYGYATVKRKSTMIKLLGVKKEEDMDE